MRASPWLVALPLLLFPLLGCDAVPERLRGDTGASSAAANGDGNIAVHVGFIALDPESGSPIVVLEEDGGTRVLPMLIPLSAAQSIAVEMEQESLPRPNTHDLAKSLLDGLEGEVERVVVTELRSGTFYAVLVVQSQGRRLEIDSRPSDAIAIALRVRAPVYVRESLLEGSDAEEDDDEESDLTVERRA